MSKYISALVSLVATTAFVVLCAAPPAYSAANCGNGNLQDPEECDEGQDNGEPGSCCSIDCTLLGSGETCRAAAPGLCDIAEVCNGTSAACPVDSVAASTVVCRPSLAGVCDSPENCTGSTPTCPDDVFAADTTVCRASGGVCDPAEECTGTSGSCPGDDKEPSTTVCRPNQGVCDDGAENCTGSTNTCPTDVPQNQGVTCRASEGNCDIAEVCDGASTSCPEDAHSSAVCRPSLGVCDPAESCSGTLDNCPADAKSTSECRAAGGVCDIAEDCDGASPTCPSDTKEDSTTVCRPNQGVCDDGEETCTGSTNACPTDVPQNEGVTCRASEGACDIAEECDGSSSSCPADQHSSSVCRPSGGVCDIAESCDGAADDCPADVVSSAVCRPAVHPDCDVLEECTGNPGDYNCPDDVLIGCASNDGVDCTEAVCLANGDCAVVENCTEICRGQGFWATHGGDEKDHPNLIQEIIDEAGPLLICGHTVDLSDTLGTMSAYIENICIIPKGGSDTLKLDRVLATTAANCAISEGGDLSDPLDEQCDNILNNQGFTVTFSYCNELCDGGPVVDEVDEKECMRQLKCFNGGGRLIDDECVTGTCADDESNCKDDEDCGEEIECVPFEGSCKTADLCSDDLDAPAEICPQWKPASSPKICRDAKHSDCNTINEGDCF